MKNPLLEKYTSNYGTAPFSNIKTEHFQPALLSAIELAREEIKLICDNTENPSFENTVEALEFSGMDLKRISSVFFNLNSAETNEEIQRIAQEVSPLLSEFANDIRLNLDLFNRVKTVYNKKDKLHLTIEQDTLLSNQYKMFVRNGANLDEESKLHLRELDKKLSTLSLKFGENILAETNNFEYLIEEKKYLKGLPESAIEAAKLLAKEKGKNGWIINLDYPSYIPFMTYAEDRSLRKILSNAFGSRGFQNNEYDNQEIVLEITRLRYERANLLGYNTHADFVLEERMAENPKKVKKFLNEILEKAKPAALKEFEKINNLAKEYGIENIQKWDSALYSEKLKKHLFDFDDEQLKPYFKLENVVNGVFSIAKKLYGLNFEEVFDIDKYHKDVRTFIVTGENNEFIAVFYADFFPRKGKRNGAWMTSFKDQWVINDENSRPHISIVCNFTKPTETKPSLLTFNEVTTLFHEFGHALHGMLANTTYPSISGTNVYWDFVELPSQIFENWCFEKEALNLFAKHFETGEIIPMDLVQKIKDSSNFLEGIATLRQISFGLLDMAWHGENPNNIEDVKQFETDAFTGTLLYPDVAKNCMSTAFSHIFQGGYSSGYYSYKWAEVLDADAFEAFLENGIFDRKTADKFKKYILSQGGTQKPMELYKKFRGKEPKTDALLKRAGLMN